MLKKFYYNSTIVDNLLKIKSTCDKIIQIICLSSKNTAYGRVIWFLGERGSSKEFYSQLVAYSLSMNKKCPFFSNMKEIHMIKLNMDPSKHNVIYIKVSYDDTSSDNIEKIRKLKDLVEQVNLGALSASFIVIVSINTCMSMTEFKTNIYDNENMCGFKLPNMSSGDLIPASVLYSKEIFGNHVLYFKTEYEKYSRL